MYYVQAAPFVCFIITAFRIAQRWFGEWKIVLQKDEKPLEEGSIASVIEEAVVEDTYREKEPVEDIEAIQDVYKRQVLLTVVSSHWSHDDTVLYCHSAYCNWLKNMWIFVFHSIFSP